tara:strand:- start:60 stop:908 length:849 start_codon:yes stop_codon:yes gene_type:complete
VKYKDIFLKCDDDFKLGYVNGGKLRQALTLIEKHLEEIKTQHNSVVVCPCSNKSPQSAIMSEVCKVYELKCKVVTYKTKKPNLNLSIAQFNGAKLYGTKVGWNSVIEARAKELGGFNIKMGFGSDDIIGANIEQVQNLPLDLDFLVVPVGSGYNFISIAKGLIKYNIKVGELIGVWIGKDPRNLISAKIKGLIDYTLIKYPSQYSTSLTTYGTDFDEIYEAKAYDYIMKNLDYKKYKTLLWVIGKRNYNFQPTKLFWEDNMEETEQAVEEKPEEETTKETAE